MKRLPPHSNPPTRPRFRPLASIRARLHDTRGFMLGEQLVSVIFIGLLCIVVAAGMGAAMSAYADITRQTQADMMLSQVVEVVSDELTYAQDDGEAGTLGAAPDGNSATFISPTLHAKADMLVDGSGIVLREKSKGVVTVLVAAADGMRPSVSFALDADKKTWTISVMIVPENATGTVTLAQVQDLKVQRIGS